ncbi:MAG: hypothetical protein JNL38_10305 [Myxococcales bacterium]|nr:hypothetical protein [Myxococcales bacterium]
MSSARSIDGKKSRIAVSLKVVVSMRASPLALDPWPSPATTSDSAGPRPSVENPMPNVWKPDCPETYVVFTQAPVAVLTRKSDPSLQTTNAVPSRSTAIENGVAVVLAGHARMPMVRNAPEGGL